MRGALFLVGTFAACAVQAQDMGRHRAASVLGSRAAERAMAVAPARGARARGMEMLGAQRVTTRGDTSRAERWARDTTAATRSRRTLRRRPFVLVGALLGGAVGAYVYAETVRGNGDGDFLAPISIPIVVGGGALLGALGGAVAGRLAQAISGR